MIVRFPFQKWMWTDGYYSFIIILGNSKIVETSNNEIFNEASKIHAVVITIIMKFHWHFQKSMWAETGMNFAWP